MFAILIKYPYLLRPITIRWIGNAAKKHFYIVYDLAYRETLRRFPDNKLRDNINIAQVAANRFFFGDNDGGPPDYDVAQASSINTWLESSTEARQHAAYNHLLIAWLFENMSPPNGASKSEETLQKARHFVPDIQVPTPTQAKHIAREGAKKHRKLRNENHRLNRERVKRERQSLIGTIRLSVSHITFSIYLFSLLFLVGSILYNYIFFSAFGIRITDFFQLQDYVSSSLPVISSATLATAGSLIFYFLGTIEQVDRELHADQFEIEDQSNSMRNLIAGIVLISAIGLVVTTYITGEILELYLYPLVIFVSFQLFYKLPLWSYIENPLPAGAVGIAIIIFAFHLGIRIKDDIKATKHDQFTSPYQLRLVAGYEEYKTYKYLSNTSEYSFLLSPDGNKVVVVPNDAITLFQAGQAPSK